jgi:hypothetical protein
MDRLPDTSTRKHPMPKFKKYLPHLLVAMTCIAYAVTVGSGPAHPIA